jgi:hypothetical protein
MNYLFKLDGIVWTQLVSDAFTTVISFALYHHTYKKLAFNDDIVN